LIQILHTQCLCRQQPDILDRAGSPANLLRCRAIVDLAAYRYFLGISPPSRNRNYIISHNHDAESHKKLRTNYDP